MSDIILTGSGDFSKLKQEYDKLHKENVKLAGNLRDVTRASEEASKAGQKMAHTNQAAFGAGVLRDLQGMVAGWVSVGTAINVARQALDSFRAVQDQAAAKERQSRMGMGSLAQVAKSQEHYQQLIKKAEEFYAGGGAATKDEAARTVFALESAGEMENFDLFKKLRATGLVETPDVMARAAKTMQMSMGKEETGSTRDILSKAIAAGMHAPARAEDLLESASKPARIGRAIGLTDEEVLAAQAIGTAATGTAPEGSTLMSAMLTAMEQAQSDQAKAQKAGIGKDLLDRFAKANLTGKMDIIEAEGGIETGKFREFFGAQEARSGYRAMAGNRGEYAAALADIQKAQAEDLVGKRMEFHKTDKPQVAAGLEEQSEASVENARRGLATATSLSNAMMNKYEEAVRLGEIKTLLPMEADIALNRMAAGTARWLGGDVNYLRNIQQAGGLGIRTGGDKGLQAEVEALIGPSPPRNRTWIGRMQDALGFPEENEAANARQAGAAQAPSRQSTERARGEQDVSDKQVRALLEQQRRILTQIAQNTKQRPPAGPQPAFNEPAG